MNRIMMELLVKLLPFILTQLTPAIKDLFYELVYKLEEAADKTPNPVDNILVDALKTLFNVPDQA